MGLITPFDPWRGELCTCPPKYSLSPYVGCSHRCVYCYASSYIRNFFLVREKKNFLLRLRKEVRKIEKGIFITMANSTDPYLPQERKSRLTRESLKILANREVKIMIVTKSSLVVRDIDILKSFKKVVVSFSLTTLKKELAERLEPSAPSPQERLEAMEKLSPYVNVVCRLDPLIYPLNIGEIEEIVKEVVYRGAKQIITSTYKVRRDNFKRMVNSFPECESIWRSLYLAQGEKKRGYIYLSEEMRKELIEMVREVSLKYGVDFSSCREGFAYLNTAKCDGSSFFDHDT